MLVQKPNTAEYQKKMAIFGKIGINYFSTSSFAQKYINSEYYRFLKANKYFL